jgi:quercetin dioxygenase-like cupin family protein
LLRESARENDSVHVKLSDCPVVPSRHGNPKQVLAGPGVLPNVTQVAVAVFEGLMETELHSHPTMYESYFVLEGEAVYTVGEERYAVAPGDFFVVPPGTIHNQRVTVAPHRIFLWGIATGDLPADSPAASAE